MHGQPGPIAPAQGHLNLNTTDTLLDAVPAGQRLRTALSRLSLAVSAVLLAATFLFISPPEGQTFPGQIPWGDNSLLKGIVDAMSLGGLIHTVRGVEIKDLALHVCAVLLLLIFAARAAVSARWPAERRAAPGAWLWTQLALAAWVALSALSALWSGDSALSLGQATLYAFGLAIAIGLAWTLEVQHVPALLAAYSTIAAIGGTLCVWYFHERNPAHRPGFPIGNPSPLAASVMPAILICGAYLAGQAREWWVSRKSPPSLPTVAAAVGLIPLGWCFWLAGSRGAALGAVAGVVGVAWMRAGRRLRWATLAIFIAAAAIAGTYVATRSTELTMARSETIRFRAYAWQYAAMLWGQRTISGQGAGSYPRLANVYSLRDRVLDPAAFMAELVEHAHNELFEVLAEIGLVGGLTFVIGYIATLRAAASILEGNLSRERRYLLMGLVAGVIGLLADACVGVGLRLPGLPAVHFTLLGVLWSVGRATSKTSNHGQHDPGPQLARQRAGFAGAIGALVLALLLAVQSGRNWRGVSAEYQSSRAAAAGNYERAASTAVTARENLLDPVRVIVAQQQEVFARVDLAGLAVQRFFEQQPAVGNPTSTQPTDPSSPQEVRRRGAQELCEQALQSSLLLNQRAPTFSRMAAMAARCCEWLAELNADVDQKKTADWRRQAFEAWTYQRLQRPFDLETLLALAGGYPATIEQRIGWLRDALRAGFPNPRWYQALSGTMALPGADNVLRALVGTAGPFDPQTQLDALVVSMAPETLRLASAWLLQAERSAPTTAPSEMADACELVQRAAALYQPMRPRFPELYSVALAEAADCHYRRDAGAAQSAIELLAQATRALPVIQEQKYQEMAKPYRVRLAQYQLAAGRTDDARATLATVPIEPSHLEEALSALRSNLVRIHPPPASVPASAP